ncbi:MAG: hypothetical protein P8Z81_09980 [Deinococcales bacterium]
MKHLETTRRNPSPLPGAANAPSTGWLASFRSCLGKLIQTWRPGPTSPRHTGPVHPRGRVTDAHARLVALYTEASTLHDCALVETRVGEDALSYGDELKAAQHFAYSRHYRLRAQETQTSIGMELARLQQERTDWEQLSSTALTRARERLYGSAELAGRPQFD